MFIFVLICMFIFVLICMFIFVNAIFLMDTNFSAMRMHITGMEVTWDCPHNQYTCNCGCHSQSRRVIWMCFRKYVRSCKIDNDSSKGCQVERDEIITQCKCASNGGTANSGNRIYAKKGEALLSPKSWFNKKWNSIEAIAKGVSEQSDKDNKPQIWANFECNTQCQAI